MELEFLHWLREHVPPDPRLPLGLSDDAAVISLGGHSDLVVTTDLLTDGVDFDLGPHDPQRIGRQALGANLSDLAAMAARPLVAVVSLALPHTSSAGPPLPLAIKLYEGLLPLAKEFGVAVAGGDTNTYHGPLVINATVLGEVSLAGPLTRSGGRAGDWLLVTGALGGSILGHMLDFTPRVREALLLHERYELHAGIDVSDGLALDASRLAEASGCGVVLFVDRIPVSPDAFELARRDAGTSRHGADALASAALNHALSDGQDFELLLAAPPMSAQAILRDQPLACPVTYIGELTGQAGLWEQDAAGERKPMKPSGWIHL